MASGFTNYGKLQFLRAGTKGVSLVVTSSLKAMLITSAVTPNPDDETWSEWVTRGAVEIAAGNGYTSGGITVEYSSTGWPTGDDTEDNTNDRGSVKAKDLSWTASGGPIPSSGSGARYMLLTDDHATLNSRKVFAWLDLSSDRSITDGGTLTLADTELRAT